GGVPADEAADYFWGHVAHGFADSADAVGPDAVRMRVVAGPEQVFRAPELEQPHRGGALLEGPVNLALEHLAGLHLVRDTALVVPELLAFPQTPVAVIQFLDHPGNPADAAFGNDDLQFRMPFEDAPGEQIDERIEELFDEHLGVEERGAGAAFVLVECLGDAGE